MRSISAVLIKRMAHEDEAALSACYREFYARFFHRALQLLRDEHAAQEAFDDAFLKFLQSVKRNFSFRGTAQTIAYFEKALKSAIVDHTRTKKPLEVPLPKKEEDEDPEDLIPDHDPIAEETERARYGELYRKSLEDFLKVATKGDKLIAKGYRALSRIPGADSWPAHKKTKFLQDYCGLKPSAFYPAHSRMKKKLEAILRAHGLIRGQG